jgi:transposase
MLRRRTVQRIQELLAQGLSIRAVAHALDLSRNTVRKYAHGMPEPRPRRLRGSKLDPFKDQIRRWVQEDHLYNCEVMLARLVPLGYTGKVSTIKDFVQPLRPRHPQRHPVQRFETEPGEQLQFDWGEFRYTRADHTHKLYGFTAILSYSRMRFVIFTKRCTAPIMIQCLLAACEYFGGLPQAVLTDRMKTVLLSSDGITHHWHPLFEDWTTSVGVIPRVCRPRSPQTKGKVERSIGVIKQSFWAGCQFTDIHDLNRQARAWCDRRNALIHATTRERPLDRWPHEHLRALPQDFAWQRFRCEDRRVTWDGYVSYDGVLYGVPADAGVVGQQVQVSCVDETVVIWAQGQPIVRHAQRAESGTIVTHPAQFAAVPPASTFRHAHVPLATQLPTPPVERRSLAEYDALCEGGHP